jgi:hypothetical protein
MLRAERGSVAEKPSEELVDRGRNKREKKKLMTLLMPE